MEGLPLSCTWEATDWFNKVSDVRDAFPFIKWVFRVKSGGCYLKMNLETSENKYEGNLAMENIPKQCPTCLLYLEWKGSNVNQSGFSFSSDYTIHDKVRQQGQLHLQGFLYSIPEMIKDTTYWNRTQIFFKNCKMWFFLPHLQPFTCLYSCCRCKTVKAV